MIRRHKIGSPTPTGGLVSIMSYSRLSLMIFASRTQFHVHLPWGHRQCLNSVLNVKALVGAFNQEKALVGAFSVIVKPVVKPMDRFTALSFIHCRRPNTGPHINTLSAAKNIILTSCLLVSY